MAPEPSFARALFEGRIEEERVLPYPELTPGERDGLERGLDEVRRLGKTLDSADIDRRARIPEAVVDRLRELGLFGLTVPERFGGAGLSHTAYARMIEELARIDASVAVTVGAHHSIGLMGLLRFGTENQKQRYLPRLARGEWIAGFALTEPGAGSDAASVRSRVEPSPDGEGYVLNGNKIWVTNGGIGDLFTVFARSHHGEPHGRPGVTALLVERGPGLGSGPNEPKMGIRGASTTSLYFEDVRVHAANVLGDHGDGFRVAMEVLNDGRVGLAAGCVGGCKQLVGMAVARCRERRAFGRPIGDFEMVRAKVARMVCDTFALESMTYLTTGLIDAGAPDYAVESAICKVYGSETYWRVANETLQIAAGIGYMADHPYERMLRDARINLIFEGTNEILRAFIGLTGLQAPANGRVEVLAALRRPLSSLGLLGEHAAGRVRRALGRERMAGIHPILERQVDVLERGVDRLHREARRSLRIHGTDVTEKQLVQKRIADAAIDLYALVAVLARTTRAIEARGEEGAHREIDMTSTFAALADERVSRNLDRVDREEDALLEQIATDAYDEGGYGCDLIR